LKKKKPKTHLSIISALAEGDIVMFGRGANRYEEATKFIAYFCNHEKVITYAQRNHGMGSNPYGTCVCRRNGSE